jgi:hypothetical protein
VQQLQLILREHAELAAQLPVVQFTVFIQVLVQQHG